MKAIYPIIALLSLPFFLYGMEIQRQYVNVDMKRVDQHAYMYNARKIAHTDFQYMGDRNRMPLFTSLMALFYEKNMPLQDFFEIGKRVGEVIAIVVLATFFCVLRVYAKTPDALAATLVAAFTVFAYKAPYFQAEVLFYGLSFAFFVLILRLIARPRLWIAAAAGALGGITYLTKASAPPTILLCLMCLAIHGIVELRRRFRPHADGDATDGPSWRSMAAPWYCGLALVLCFLIVVSPYIRQNKKIFGHYFYNVNTTFYMWYDSWAEAKKGTYAHGDKVGWPDMPEDQIPSMRKYLREHTTGQILERFRHGARITWKRAWHAYGYVPFVSFYVACLAAIVLCNIAGFLRLMAVRKNMILSFFLVSYFVGYLLLYAWYTYIGPPDRFVLALFLPALFVFVRLLALAQKNDWPLFRIADKRVPASWVSPAVLIMLLAYVAFVFPHRVSTMFGGM
ncbi:hypothetical protein JW916_14765 [Candidatus Sumerlaeota bacterium]|nr:hypothetical protein [Candidatus Sumerlaeota bacterium]